MRADGEISKDEYQAMRSPVDEEIKKLQKALDEIPQEKSNPKGLDIEGIRSTLNSFIDFSGSTISHDVVNQFVYLITPTSDTTFDWYVNLNGTADVKATFTAEGRKKNCIIKLEEIEKISSVHREKNEDNAHFIKNPPYFYLSAQAADTAGVCSFRGRFLWMDLDSNPDVIVSDPMTFTEMIARMEKKCGYVI